MSDSIVIIGSGLAGISVARELRKLDKQTPLSTLYRKRDMILGLTAEAVVGMAIYTGTLVVDQ